MAENGLSLSVSKSEVRPALIADRRFMEHYSEWVRRLLVGLSSEAYHPALVCDPGSESGTVLDSIVELIPYPLFRFPLFYQQNRAVLIEKLSAFKPTVLHCVTGRCARLTRYLAMQLDIPYVISFDYVGGKLIKPPISETHCFAMIGSSESTVEKLKERYKLFADDIFKVNTGTFVEDDCTCFQTPGRIASLVIAQELYDGDAFEPLLNAIRHLAIDGYEIFVAIIGKGRAARRIYRQVIDLGLSQVVSMVSQMTPLREVLSGGDIFVLPQLSRKLNTHLLEAVSVGMAVAACRDCHEDYLIEGKTAVFFDSHDEFSIYACLQKLLDKREFARQLGSTGQEYLREHHSVSRMTELLTGIYRDAQRSYKKEAAVESES